MLLVLDENLEIEGLITTLFVAGGVGLGLVVAVGLWLIFNRMRRRRSPR